MKGATLLFCLLFLSSGGVLTTTFFDVGFMKFTMCHYDSQVNKSESSTHFIEREVDKLDHEHIEVNIIEVVPRLLHGDRLACNKKHRD